MFILTCKIAKTLYLVLGTDNYMRKKKQFSNNKIFPSIDKAMLLVCMMNGNYYLIFFPFHFNQARKTHQNQAFHNILWLPHFILLCGVVDDDDRATTRTKKKKLLCGKWKKNP